MDQDPDVQVLLDLLGRMGADSTAIERAQQAGQLGALVVELAATSGHGISFDAAVAEAGTDPDLAAALWRALGFPDPTQAGSRLLPDDVRMLGLMTAASSDLLGRDATLRLARVIGEATAKIGDAVVGAFRAQIEAPSRVAGDPYADTVTTYADLVSGSLPPLQEAVGACVRRHVIQAAAGSWTLTPGEAQPRRDLVVGFVDLAGWTALSRIADDVALARAVERFEGLVSNAATEHDIRVVKFLGDGAMVVAEAADAVCRFANAVISTVAADDVLPPARVGLAAGSVLPSGGDYHGPTVNLAARLAAVASPSSALADEETQRRASDVTFGPLRVYELRGITEPMRAAIVAA